MAVASFLPFDPYLPTSGHEVTQGRQCLMQACSPQLASRSAFPPTLHFLYITRKKITREGSLIQQMAVFEQG